jgi:hypothetical protein
MGRDLPMTATIGFDRRVDLAWLDSIASRFAEAGDPQRAFDGTRAVVGLTVGGGPSPHNATGKTMTVLARIWLRVPAHVVPLRDQAAQQIPLLSPRDRLAVHWTMTELAYPFFLDAASTAGRLLRLQEQIALSEFKQRLSEQWGQRGTMPQAAQRLLKTWADWGVLRETGKGAYAAEPTADVGDVATRLAVRARLAAEGGKPIPIADIAVLPDLFPFNLGELRAALRGSPDIAMMGSSAALAVAG